jgi:hypothetical protein
MVSIVPYPMRIKAALLAAALAVTAAGCASTATESAGPITPVSVDCPQLTGPGAVALADLEGFTVTELCPSEAFPEVMSGEFDSLAAGLVSQDGNQILRVLVGQPKSGNGDVFVGNYIAGLAEHTRDGVGVPSETQQLGEHAVTHFNVPLTAEGYAYSNGPTVVIAYVGSGSPPATVDDALNQILDNV